MVWPTLGSRTAKEQEQEQVPVGFVWIQTKPVVVQPAMDGLETVVDNAECLVRAESDV